eukprot:CAMPEP_0113937844 /NCGR_PEP_ID=MMETSP1339-20121228/4361_1 /TAXON_ID=94617 /ORGANISM="Fibrocapsa japonica" /LENGTH=303 /DNA_ID=CAMNT_0000940751 /DNA_START=138 /DNA_END=1049 /DNA_ORIENTATION=+ /assembly_acc=CAM_ASM_000762
MCRPPPIEASNKEYNAKALCPEFLRKLVQILSEEEDEIIHWDKGLIFVNDPNRLCSEILSKYFRHSRYSSFQRQLNYFGFKKVNGKGKLAPCVYSCKELERGQIHDILRMKRKRHILPSRKQEAQEPNAFYPTLVAGYDNLVGDRKKQDSRESYKSITSRKTLPIAPAPSSLSTKLPNKCEGLKVEAGCTSNYLDVGRFCSDMISAFDFDGPCFADFIPTKPDSRSCAPSDQCNMPLAASASSAFNCWSCFPPKGYQASMEKNGQFSFDEFLDDTEDCDCLSSSLGDQLGVKGETAIDPPLVF